MKCVQKSFDLSSVPRYNAPMNKNKTVYIASFYRENGGSITISAGPDKSQVMQAVRRFVTFGPVPSWLAGGKVALDTVTNNKLVERIFP